MMTKTAIAADSEANAMGCNRSLGCAASIGAGAIPLTVVQIRTTLCRSRTSPDFESEETRS